MATTINVLKRTRTLTGPKLSSDIVKLKWKNVMLSLAISGIGVIVFIDLVWR
jgi:hypothetical protein